MTALPEPPTPVANALLSRQAEAATIRAETMARIASAVGELTRCLDCKGCCRNMSTLPIVSDVDVQLHHLVRRRDEDGHRVLDFDPDGTCSHLDRHGRLGCQLHPSHHRELGGQPVWWPSECAFYPFHIDVYGRLLMFATCAHVGAILERLTTGDEAAHAALGVLFDLLPGVVPQDLRDSVWRKHQDKWTVTIQLHDRRNDTPVTR